MVFRSTCQFIYSNKNTSNLTQHFWFEKSYIFTDNLLLDWESTSFHHHGLQCDKYASESYRSMVNHVKRRTPCLIQSETCILRWISVRGRYNPGPSPWDRSSSQLIMTALSMVCHSSISQSVQVVGDVIGVFTRMYNGRLDSSQGLKAIHLCIYNHTYNPVIRPQIDLLLLFDCSLLLISANISTPSANQNLVKSVSLSIEYNVTEDIDHIPSVQHLV